MLHGLRRRASGHRHLLTGSAALVLTAGVQALSGRAVLADRRTGRRRRPTSATPPRCSRRCCSSRSWPGLGQPVAAARYAAGRTRDDHVLFAWGAARHRRRRRRRSASCYLLVVSPPAVDELRDWHGAAGPALFVFLCVGHRAVAAARRAADDAAAVGPGAARGRASWASPGSRCSLIPVDQDRAVWLLAVAALPTAVSGFLGTAWLPEGHRPPPRVRAAGRRTARAWARYSVGELGLHPHLPGAHLRHAGDRAGQRQRRRQRQLLRGVGRGRAWRATCRPRSARRSSPRAGATAPSCARQVRLAIVVAGGLMVVGAAIATLGPRPHRHALRRRVPGGRRRPPRARGRRDPVGGDVRVPHRGAGAAPQRRHRAHHGRAVDGDPRARARPRARGRHRRRRHRVPLRQHRGGRRRARAPTCRSAAPPTRPIPATSPDDFEPEDAIALTPNPLT